jgi:Galactose oxidase, central domain
METLHSLIPGLRPASLILARRIAFLLLFLGAEVVLVQPCAAAPFEFEETGSLATARAYHTATLLPNGKVLVAGGYNNDYLASAELYDRASGIWTATGSLNTARRDHTATLLQNGQVLVAGGDTPGIGYLDSAELYDPATGTWTATGSMVNARTSHTATLLPSGQVLVAAGLGSGLRTLASAELYD